MESENSKRPFAFDALKAIEVILHISVRCRDLYAVLKVLYYADKEHLAKYGRLICGDQYVAMKDGPVPGGTYDIVKVGRGDGTMCSDEMRKTVGNAFWVRNHEIMPLREPDTELLSESDIECLDWAIAKYGHLGFSRLRYLSHKELAYQKADVDNLIPLEAIVESLPDGKDLLEYLRAE